jgi:hypothetical protein
MTKKIAVKKITITDTGDSNSELRGKVFTSWSEANKLTEKVADKNNGFYSKTWFTVEWQDGTQHSGRIDLEKITERTIGEHIKKYYEFHSECPKWKDRADWLVFMKYHSDDTVEVATARNKKFLATYALEDIAQENSMLKAVKYLLTKNTVGETMSILLSLNIDKAEAIDLILEATKTISDEAKAL